MFTPLEYGCCGLPEKEAIAQFGEESVEVRVVNEISRKATTSASSLLKPPFYTMRCLSASYEYCDIFVKFR